MTLTLIVLFSDFGMLHAWADENRVLIRYLGDETCEVCYFSYSIGKQFQIWKRSPHAQAYRDLGSPESMTIARKLKIVNPRKNPRCLSCHTTGRNSSPEPYFHIQTQGWGPVQILPRSWRGLCPLQRHDQSYQKQGRRPHDPSQRKNLPQFILSDLQGLRLATGPLPDLPSDFQKKSGWDNHITKTSQTNSKRSHHEANKMYLHHRDLCSSYVQRSECRSCPGRRSCDLRIQPALSPRTGLVPCLYEETCRKVDGFV